MKRGLSLVVVALATSAIVSGSAAAHKKFYGISLPIYQYVDLDPVLRLDPDPDDYFLGKITQAAGGKSPNCVAGRTLVVHTGPFVGPKDFPPDGVIGQVTTLSDGSWLLFAEDVPTGQYRLTVKEKRLRGRKHNQPGVHVCRPLEGGPIPAGP